MYQDYYTGKRQFGSGNMPVFVGAKYQHNPHVKLSVKLSRFQIRFETST